MAFDVPSAQHLAFSAARGFAEGLRTLAAGTVPPEGITAAIEALAVRSGEAFQQALHQLLEAARTDLKSSQLRLDQDQYALTEVFERLSVERARAEQETQRIEEERARLVQERIELARSREELELEWQRLRTGIQKLTDREKNLEQEQNKLAADLRALVGNQDKLSCERDRFIEDMRTHNLSSGQEHREKERQDIAQETEQLSKSREKLDTEQRELIEATYRLRGDYADLENQQKLVQEEASRVKEAKMQLDEEKRYFEQVKQQVQTDQCKLQAEVKELEQLTGDVKGRRHQLDAETQRLAEAELDVAERHRHASEQQDCARQELQKVSERWDKLEERQRALALEQSIFEEDQRQLSKKMAETDSARSGLRADQETLAKERRKFQDEKILAVCPAESLLPGVIANTKCDDFIERPALHLLKQCKDMSPCAPISVRNPAYPCLPRSNIDAFSPSPGSFEAKEAALRIIAAPCIVDSGRKATNFSKVEGRDMKTAVVDRSSGDVVSLNVGGEAIAAVARSVLLQVKGSMLADRFRASMDLGRDSDGNIFVDFQPDIFLPMLEHLRRRFAESPGSLASTPDVPDDANILRRFRDMLRYYGVRDWVYRAMPLSPELCTQVGISKFSCLPPEYAVFGGASQGEALANTSAGTVALPTGWDMVSTTSEDFENVVTQCLIRFRKASRLVVLRAGGGFDAYHVAGLSGASASICGSAPPHVDENVNWVEEVGAGVEAQRRFKLTLPSAALLIQARVGSIAAGAAFQEASCHSQDCRN